MAIKVIYFDFPGRAESIRLILTLGGVEFEDVRVSRDEWQEMKAKTPFGQCPVMEVDGTWIAQTHALERYAASVAGMLPKDALDTAKAEQLVFQMEDAWQLFAPTFKLDAEAKVAARQEMLKGAYGEKLAQVSKLLEGKDFVLGDEMCYVDLSIFTNVAILKSGWMDGIPASFLDDYPGLKAHHQRIASLDKVKAYYADKEGQLISGFKPEDV